MCYIINSMYVGVIFLRIHRLTASFGKLQGQTLELNDGLNIIEAPNETGKSTWCSFLLAMLYGINSRERDKLGFIAEKNRFAPWSGIPMSGRMDCRVGEQELTLTRTTRRQTAPMAEFQAVYSGTGDTVPNLTGQSCGETLLGVSREVYERSAFIRQSGLSITQDAGLERRIASLITSGEEETSYSETADILKRQLNRRRHNKTGQIPTLEMELQLIRQKLDEMEQLEAQLHSSQAETEALSHNEAVLSDELSHYQLWEALQKQKALTEAKSAAQQAKQRAFVLRQQLEEDHIPENDTIGRLRGALVNLETTRKSVEKARSERDEAAKMLFHAEAAMNENPFAGQTAEGAWESATSVSDSKPWPLSELLPSLFMGAVALFLSIMWIFGADSSYLVGDAIVYGIPLGIASLVLPFYKNQKWKKETAAFLEKHGVSSAAELRQLASDYGDLLKTRDAAQAELDKRSAAADTLYNTLSSIEQAILLEIRRFAPAAFDSAAADSLLRECAQRRKALSEAEAAAKETQMRYELLAQQTSPVNLSSTEEIAVPLRSADTIIADLTQTRVNLSSARSMTDRLAGQLQAIGDPAILQASAAQLSDEISRLEAEYTAIRLAMDVLERSNTTLQNRFSPALGKRAAEIFSELTDGRYSSVVLDRTFHLSAEPKGDTVYRDAQLLSAGTNDQLYLATRLAICDLVLPAEYAVPIVLDDALTNFDDERCAVALRWLKEASHTRQILLFTCHSREADFFAGDKEVSVQRLTNYTEKV